MPKLGWETHIDIFFRLVSALIGAFFIGLGSGFALLSAPCKGGCGDGDLVYAIGLSLIAFVASFAVLLWLRINLFQEKIIQRRPEEVRSKLQAYWLALLVLIVIGMLL